MDSNFKTNTAFRVPVRLNLLLLLFFFLFFFKKKRLCNWNIYFFIVFSSFRRMEGAYLEICGGQKNRNSTTAAALQAISFIVILN